MTPDSIGISVILLYSFALNDLLQKKEKDVKELPKQHSLFVEFWCSRCKRLSSGTTIFILFYPITLGGRRGTTDEFATIPFHLDLCSAALVELAKSIPVHSLILSSHLFFCLPLFLFPFTVPCRIVFA